MKTNIASIAIITLLLAFPLYAQAPADGGGGTGDATGGNATEPRDDTQGVQNALVIEPLDDFEEAEDWIADATSPLGETKTLKIVQRGDIRATDDENSKPPEGEALSVDQDPNNPNHILGVKTYFDDRGFDRVEVSPPHEYIIKGKARQFSIWVLGRRYRNTFSIKLRDYRGKIHKLELGRLDFYGWRKLTVTVPGWLPQSTRFSMMDKNLHFVSLFVTHDHHEVPGTFYFYVDGLKVMVDKSETSYPGSEIKDNW